MRSRLLLAGFAIVFGVGLATAADDAITIALKDFKLKVAFDGMDALVGYNEGDEKVFMYTNGSATAAVKIPADGEYTLTLKMSCDEARKVKAKVKITADSATVKDDFELTTTDAKDYTFTVKLKKGTTKLGIAYLNDEFKENEYDRNFYLHAAKLEPKK